MTTTMVYLLDLGPEPNSYGSFLDQVDMGVNMGGLVLSDTTLAKIKDDLNDSEILIKRYKYELYKIEQQRELFQSDFIRLNNRVEEAYSDRDVDKAMGIEMMKKHWRITFTTISRELDQKLASLKEDIEPIGLWHIRMEHAIKLLESGKGTSNDCDDSAQM
ncbi:hypothetical protein VM1G_08785 [Cytospora mali]|uniref:Uncharacterized protein n=1 Tax=Cytospora mali TaxID=578113 RepID=A0A194WAN6_CYTMA|nr:hypothetical protein VM1G_08785 [Valsa mali]